MKVGKFVAIILAVTFRKPGRMVTSTRPDFHNFESGHCRHMLVCCIKQKTLASVIAVGEEGREG